MKLTMQFAPFNAPAGEVAKSLLIDHFGWFGAVRRPISRRRLIALACVSAALALIAGGH